MHITLRPLLCAGTLAAALFTTAPLTAAQENPSAPPEPPRRENTGNPEQRLNRLKETLQLTDQQVVAIKEIFASEAEAARAAREKLGASATREQRMAARREVVAQCRAKIEAVLTEEQRTKWAEIREPMRRGGPDGQRPQGGPASDTQ